MPELPEVENFRRLLLPLVSKAGTLSLECTSSAPPRKFPSALDFKALHKNCRVSRVERKGKLICLVLECIQKVQNQKCVYLFLHMGMTGRISTPDMIPKLVELKDDSEYPPPYTHLVLKTDLAEASYSDPRKFGSVRLSTSLEDGFGELAPDALFLCGPTTATTLDGLVGKQMGIKGLLLDQKRVMSGIGNWVADEVLYQSRIHPDQTHLSRPQVEALGTIIQFVLSTAVACLDRNEEFPSDWLFHCRWGKRKKTAIQDPKGRAVTFLTSASRTSAIVPSIQRKTAPTKNSAKMTPLNPKSQDEVVTAQKKKKRPAKEPSTLTNDEILIKKRKSPRLSSK
uniref:Formamidopyrimidine-DNA glycosylase catalytic domain-containing protein n=1 Tax=Attheya septentrionalis TaxID=420275 RepID=A0A7S2XJ90_9STRA|mmetsp:Transcript_13904/g.25158  ORF Transcript_13904/g.25158 Transcript_13904/m.25158 type:complete len:340 (+) Transcript_13904:225-1244(+)